MQDNDDNESGGMFNDFRNAIVTVALIIIVVAFSFGYACGSRSAL